MGYIENYFDELSNKINSVQKAIEKLEEKVRRPSDSDWLDANDMQSRYKMAKRTQIKYRNEGKLPFHRVGGKILYKLSEIEEAITNL